MESVATASHPAIPAAAPAVAVVKRPPDAELSSQQSRQHHHNHKRRRTGKPHIRRPPTTPPPPPPPPPPTCSVCSIIKQNDSLTLQSTPKESPKYKCPKCRALYCSVQCCRKHKEICPGKPPEETSKASPNHTEYENHSEEGDGSESDDESVEEGWKITDEMKEAIQKSSWLHDELQDGGLRDMIAQVVRASKRKSTPRNKYHQHHNRRHHSSLSATVRHDPSHDALLEKRKDNPNFNIFCDKLLVLAGVLERQGNESDRVDAVSSNVPCAAAASPSATTTYPPPGGRELEQWLKQKWEPDHPPPMLALKPIRKKAIPKFEPIDVSSSSSSENEEASDDDSSNEDSSSKTSSEESSHDDKEEEM